MTRHNSCRVSPFGHPRIHARLTAPRGISQPPTSFIGSQCQGIHHAPLNTYNTKPKNESPKNPQKTGILGLQQNCIQQTHNPKAVRLDARNHYPQIKHHTPPPKQGNNKHPPTPTGQRPAPTPHIQGKTAGLLSQSPIVCLAILNSSRYPQPPSHACCRTRPASTTENRPSSRIARKTRRTHDLWGRSKSRGAP